MLSLYPKFPVAIPKGFHPFPFRTRKLSPSGPMILWPRGHGKVGCCRIFLCSSSFLQRAKTLCIRNLWRVFSCSCSCNVLFMDVKIRESISLVLSSYYEDGDFRIFVYYPKCYATKQNCPHSASSMGSHDN